MYIMAVRKPEQGLNDWGYGQILAVLIWAPVLVEFFLAVVKPLMIPHVPTEPPTTPPDGDKGKPAMSHVRED